MGQISQPRSVLAVMAAFSRHEQALDWARQTAELEWGAVALVSERFRFEQTDYYEPTMGADLLKVFFAFETLLEPSQLVLRKHQANRWEESYRQTRSHREVRPLNLDPGYISEAKLVLASTKDRDHRIYLSDGIYAEGTLFFHSGCWQARSWTYPDYRCDSYHRFFERCRTYLRKRYREDQDPSV